MSSFISAEDMATAYWRRMRRAALREVEFRLHQLRQGSPETLRYWLAVHTALEKKNALLEKQKAPNVVSIAPRKEALPV